MSVKIGSFTPGVTGDATITGLTFLPTNIQVRLGAVTGSTMYTGATLVTSRVIYLVDYENTHEIITNR